MTSQGSGASKSLPENAYRPLKDGEKYVPYIPSEKSIHEVTTRSVITGVVMAIIFSFAACYLGLVAGQVFEAAIPIAILAVGLSGIFTRRSTILENVIIQSIGSASGVVVAGAIFTLPALYILGLEVNLLHTIIACTLGGILGILFLIPLRRYFCVEEHGRLPFPEATATTEILTTGESGKKSAWVLVLSMVVGGLYDFLIEVVHIWPKTLRTEKLLGELGLFLAKKTRWNLKLDATSALFGLGYIMGVKYAAIIAAGSILSFLVLVPLVHYFGQYIPVIIPPGKELIRELQAEDIFRLYVQKIGIGAIAMAGFLGIIRMGKIIASSFKVGLEEMGHGVGAAGSQKRTDTDIRIKWVILFILITALLTFIAFRFFAASAGGIGFSMLIALVGIVIIMLLAFLFTPVAARATAIVGVNPVSGMTLITLIISAIVLVSIGLSGKIGMTVALIMGCVVCTALSTSGGFITDLKIGYWLGATPRNQQRWKFLGVLVSAVSVSLAILLIHKSYGFTIGGGILTEGGGPNPVIPAPQGNLMATIIKSLMIESQIPYLLYAMGMLIAILLEMIGVSPLAFALGMYLPIEINMPLLVGGITAHFVNKKAEKDKKGEENSPRERGILIASGFIAGGALMGVLGAVLNLQIDWHNIGKPIRFISIGIPYIQETVQETGKIIWKASENGLPYFESFSGQLLCLLAFIGLCLFCYFYAAGRKKE